MNNKVILLFVLILGVIGLGAYYLIQPTGEAAQLERPPTTVDVISVTHHTIQDTIEALGTTYANEAVNITASVTDKIQEIRFDDGQKVKKGDVIVILEQNEELAQKEAIIEQKIEHERELKRLDDLLKQKAISKNQVDARNTLLAISKYKLAEIEARIGDRTIRAPFDGVLGLRKISVGSLVEPGTIINTLDDVSKIKLDFSVPAVFLDVIKEGQTINAISEASKEKPFVGTITKIGSRVDPKTRSVEIRAILPNADGSLKPGMLLRVKLFRNKRDALLVPEEAITQFQKSHYVFIVASENTIEQKKVEVGSRQPGWVEITNGLQESDQVVVRGTMKIWPGAKVNAKEIEFSPIEQN